MKVYLVGGWVRDHLRGQPSQDRDWVVVGSTEKEMKDQGFKSVGSSFPVFLHPKTKEEYALARKERKVSAGYHGFEIFSAPSVTLEEDLSRRDLTINAMAFDPETQKIIDPFEGQKDWANGCLRHVSSAFSDDPLRLIRLARFYAVFPQMHIAPETHSLCRAITQSGELQALTPERIRLEIVKMYQTSSDPYRFWKLLQDFGAISILFPILSGIDFSEKSLPDTRGLSNPFVAGLLFLKKKGISDRDFLDFLHQLRASRSDFQQHTLNAALIQGQPNSYESLVRMLLQTRALHRLEDLKVIYHWQIEPSCWIWAQIEQAALYLKTLNVMSITDVPPSERKEYLFQFYTKSLQRAYPSLFQN